MASGGGWLQVEDLAYAYPGCSVLAGLSMRAGPGAVLVQGDEGTGKTTLLRLLAAQLKLQSGRLRLGELFLPDDEAAWVQQRFWADARSSERDALIARQWLASQAPLYAPWDAQALERHIEGFALAPHLDKPFFALSTGSQRKVLLAAALASGATLTLIDEPVAGLDKPSCTYLAHALSEAAATGRRWLVVAHYEPLPDVLWSQVVSLDR